LRYGDADLSSDSETLGYRLLRLYADYLIDELAVSENKQGRYARDAKTSSCLRILVDIEFSYPVTTLRLRCKLI